MKGTTRPGVSHLVGSKEDFETRLQVEPTCQRDGLAKAKRGRGEPCRRSWWLSVEPAQHAKRGAYDDERDDDGQGGRPGVGALGALGRQWVKPVVFKAAKLAQWALVPLNAVAVRGPRLDV